MRVRLLVASFGPARTPWRRRSRLARIPVRWSGLYSVAASRGHWAVIEWFLTFAMRNSVKTHASAIEAPPLDNADLVTLGAGAFPQRLRLLSRRAGHADQSDRAGACCRRRPISRRRCATWRDRELFWIVKHGIKYTGMPAWAAQQRDDEVWALVAFLRRLPALDAQTLSRARARRPASRRRRAGASRDERDASATRSAPARAATAPSSAARAARWCRSCTASRRSS